MDSDGFDLGQLRLAPEQIAKLTRPGQPKKWRRHFVHVPWHWVERLRGAKCVSSYRLALLLLYESWRLGGRPITLSNVSAFAEGLPRRTKWRALGELESLGLVQVRRRARHAPRVVLRHLTGEPS
jgi:hypothetical protein